MKVRSNKRLAIVVLGMHRSGTSAFARTLGLLGFTVPPDRFHSREDNPTGFWESWGANQLNDKCLADFGLAWDSVRLLPGDWLDTAIVRGYRARAAEVLHAEFGDSPTVVLKEPRMCRLFPLWELALQDVGFSPSVLLPFRHPIEVAESLARRNCFSREKGELLWLLHNLEAEAATRHLPRSFAGYDELLVDWQETVGRIGLTLGIEWPRTIEDAAPEVSGFVATDLRHHRAADADLSPGATSRWVADLYEAFRTLAGSSTDGDGLARVDAIAARLAEALPLFGPAIDDAEQGPRRQIAKLEADRNAQRLKQEEDRARHDDELRRSTSRVRISPGGRPAPP